MSGTSLDGVDAVLMCQADTSSPRMRVVGHHFIAMPYGLRQEFLALQSPQDNELHRSQIAPHKFVRARKVGPDPQKPFLVINRKQQQRRKKQPPKAFN